MRSITIQAYKGFFVKVAIIFLSFVSLALGGLFVKANIDEFAAKCDANISTSCHNVALIYANKDEWDKIDTQKYLEYYTKACDLDVSYCKGVGEIYERGYNGVPKDTTKAIEYYKRKCDSKFEDFSSCQRVGYAYEIGEGIPKDFKIASEYYAKACKNDPLGWICIRAKTTRIMAETKEESAIKAFEKACDVTKEAIACSSIARMYELGWSAYDDLDYFYNYRGGQIDLEFPKAEVAPKDLD
ncbi:MAG: sel1 repeat family protein, partial [Helicobacteraceae bacterium]|nr:sel1 repeat family protein [Helicobacteraceae bacterium]